LPEECSESWARSLHFGDRMERATTDRRDPFDTRAERFAQAMSRATGSTAAFGIALAAVLAWGVSGPVFHFSDTWQLVMNTVSSVATLLMVFLIQRAQNKDALAMHVKLNEIIKAIEGASNHIVNAEGLSEATLSRLQESYQRIAENADRRGEPPPAGKPPAAP
jgi:low affinity Fe/Cu permease